MDAETNRRINSAVLSKLLASEHHPWETGDWAIYHRVMGYEPEIDRRYRLARARQPVVPTTRPRMRQVG